MPIQARSSPYVIVVTVPIRLPAQDVAKPAWTKSQKSLPITLGLVHSSLSSSCNACSAFAESLLQPCQHGLDSASSAIRFINCSGPFIRTSLLVRDDPSHPAVAQNNDGLSLLYTGLRLRHDRETSPHATGNSRPHA